MTEDELWEEIIDPLTTRIGDFRHYAYSLESVMEMDYRRAAIQVGKLAMMHEEDRDAIEAAKKG